MKVALITENVHFLENMIFALKDKDITVDVYPNSQLDKIEQKIFKKILIDNINLNRGRSEIVEKEKTILLNSKDTDSKEGLNYFNSKFLEKLLIEVGHEDLSNNTNIKLIENLAIYQTNSVELSRTEHKILKYLIAHPNRLIYRTDLMVNLWSNMNKDITPNNIDVFISKIRRKLKSIGADVKLETIHGYGYKLVTNTDPQ